MASYEEQRCKRLYLMVGLGMLDESHRRPAISAHVGGGYVLPMWNHIGLRVELSYEYAASDPPLGVMVNTIGLQWEF